MRLLLPLGLPLVLLLALAIRALPWPVVFTAHGLLPGSLTDEPYHLRRIWYSVVHFPEVLTFDPYVNFPDGGFIHWPPGFDWMVAAVARLLVGAEDRVAVETVAVWVPVALGVLTVAATAWVAYGAFGRGAALTAGAILAVLPASWVFSQVGLIDHHVAVALAGMLLLGLSMAWLRAEGSRVPVGLTVGLGLTMALPLLIWPGFLLHLGVAQLGLLVATLGAAERGVAGARARSLAGAHALAALLVLPFCLGPPIAQYGAWSPLVLSRFQPTWLAGGALVLAAVAASWAGSAGGRSRPLRIGLAALLGGGGVLAVLSAAPGLRESLLYASGWFTQSDEVRTVTELLPQSFVTATTRYSWAFFLFPLAWGGVAARALRTRRPDLAMLLFWSAAFLGLALLQRRFNNSFAAPYALVWAGGAALGLPALRRLAAGRPLRMAGLATAALLLAAIVLLPVVAFYEAPVRKSRAALEEHTPPMTLLSPLRQVHVAAARWMAGSTPPTRGYMDVSKRPEYGVLCSWGVGHLVRYLAERPLVMDNFGVYGGRESFERAWAYYEAKEEGEALALLDRLRVRYVMATRHGAGRPAEDYAPGTMTHRLSRLYGSAAVVDDPTTGERLRIPALAHHRLVFHARTNASTGLEAPSPQADLAVYERVRGARVEGRAAPGARVEARLRLTTGGGRRLLPRASGPHVHRAATRADASGRWTLTLPYSTDTRFSDAVRVLGPWQLETDAGRASLDVPEAAVQEGATLAGPDLGPPRSARTPPPSTRRVARAS